jgi:serine/threonine protein kinase
MPVRIANMAEPIPGYRLVERLGHGGFGEVWKCEAPGGLLKAIKFVYGDLGGIRGEEGVAAEQELKALSRVKTIRHPFILSLERYDIIDGQLIIVMELADRNLYNRFEQCRSQGLPGIPREELLRYMEEAAEALDLMNIEHQLQHLDIKPQNLFLVHNHIKVADFGLVKDLEGMKASVTGGVTPLYAAPETFEGWVSRYSDQYSLAIVYQELLTGQRPFSGTNSRQLVLQHVTAPPDLSALPPGDREIIGRALAKKPEERHASCGDMVRALRAAGAADPIIAARPPSIPPRPSDTDASRQTATGKRPGPWVDQFTPSRLRGAPAPVDRALSDSAARTRPTLPGEVEGDGVLLPALVIGVGETGLGVLQRLREALHSQFGAADALPHLRLLYLDLDPDSLRKAVEGPPAAALQPSEVVLARLNRPAHYLKPRDGLAAVQSWLEPQMLFRIPRNQLTAGFRALGRLAFLDNYHTICNRLQEALEHCVASEALATADKNTGLGVRHNRPRVYVVCSLSGGTGSGMFLDLAYVVRSLLRQMGHDRPELIGVFFLPAAERLPGRVLALSNTYAALTELNHFSSLEVTFSARYDTREQPITDPAPPFARCVLLPLPGGSVGPEKVIATGAACLFHELVTPVGRAVDSRRPTPPPARPLACTTVGTYRFSWPRRTLLALLAKELCRRLVQHWMSPDATAVQAEVQDWVAAEWEKRQLAPVGLTDPLEAACEKVLGEMPEAAFQTVITRLGRRVPGTVDLDPNAVASVLAELEKLVGRPDQDTAGQRGAIVVDTLDETVRRISSRFDKHLAQMAVALVEQPRFRLAGGEEAIRQLAARLQAVTDAQADLARQAAAQAAEAYSRLRGMLDTLRQAANSRRKGPAVAADEVIGLLRWYPRLRYQALLQERVTAIYRSMLASCPEYLREFSFCRQRLTELQRNLDTAAPQERAEIDLGPGRHLFPPGCKTVEELAIKLMQKVSKEELLDLDQQLQELIRKQFKALVNVLTGATNLLKDLEKLLYEQVEPFAATRLGKAQVVEMFLDEYVSADAVGEALTRAFEKTRPSPDSLPPAMTDNALLVLPVSAAASRLRDLVHRALPKVEVVQAPGRDDIVCYREQAGLALADLPQFGPEARAAYEEMLATEHYTPHSRLDITDWGPLPRH